MEPNLQTIILKGLIHDENFCRKALPHIKPEYFQNEHRVVYELILKFIAKYNKLPNSAVLNIEFQNSDKIADTIAVSKLISDANTPEIVEYDWLVNTTEKWCKDRAVHIAIMESIAIIDGRSTTNAAEGMIPDILSKALAVTFDTNVGHDYIEDAQKRFDFYHRIEDKIAFDIDMLNQITNGGVTRKTLNIILAGTAVGKSLAMCHLAAAALAQGRNVLYITMEMSEEKIAERNDANLFDLPIDQIGQLSNEMFNHKIKNIANKTHGKLIIKEYPTGAAHVGHFRALLMELKLKKNFVPDIIFVDYLNICASSRIRGGAESGTYTLIKSIAEELRGLAVEFNVPVWSATQVTRSGYCIDLKSIISTSNGDVSLEEIKVGDLVTNVSGGFNEVLNVFPKTKKKAYRITLSSGKTILCSKDHKFPTAAGEYSIQNGLSLGMKLFTK